MADAFSVIPLIDKIDRIPSPRITLTPEIAFQPEVGGLAAQLQLANLSINAPAQVATLNTPTAVGVQTLELDLTINLPDSDLPVHATVSIPVPAPGPSLKQRVSAEVQAL